MKKNKYLILTLFVLISLFSCQKDEYVDEIKETIWRISISWSNDSERVIIMKFNADGTNSRDGDWEIKRERLNFSSLHPYSSAMYVDTTKYYGKYNGLETMSGLSDYITSTGDTLTGKWDAQKIVFGSDLFTDSRDGYTYKTVTIGTQTWMAENLNYRNPTGTKYYNNDSLQNCGYGRLYTWDAAIQSCPDGWRLPSDNDWATLVEYLGGDDYAGRELKEVGIDHWSSPNSGTTNLTGFSAIGGGVYVYNFANLNGHGYYWSSTATSNDNANCRHLIYGSNICYSDEQAKAFFLSVRYIKD